MKTFLPGFIVAALAFSTAYFAWQAYKKPDPSAYVTVEKYNADVKERDQKLETSLAVIAEREQAIVERDRKIAAILQSAGQPTAAEKAKDAKIGELERRVATFESQGDLRAALDASKAECREWSEKFSLAEKRHKGTIDALKAEFDLKSIAQDDRFNKAMEALEQEKSFRLSCESLNKKLMPKKWEKPLEWAIRIGFFIAGNVSHG